MYYTDKVIFNQVELVNILLGCSPDILHWTLPRGCTVCSVDTPLVMDPAEILVFPFSRGMPSPLRFCRWVWRSRRRRRRRRSRRRRWRPRFLWLLLWRILIILLVLSRTKIDCRHLRIRGRLWLDSCHSWSRVWLRGLIGRIDLVSSRKDLLVRVFGECHFWDVIPDHHW